jgi:hypothetical protein
MKVKTFQKNANVQHVQGKISSLRNKVKVNLVFTSVLNKCYTVTHNKCAKLKGNFYCKRQVDG